MNIQRKNSAHHFRMQSEREQTLEHELIQLDDYDEKRVEYGLCGYHNTFDTFGPFVLVEFE